MSDFFQIYRHRMDIFLWKVESWDSFSSYKLRSFYAGLPNITSSIPSPTRCSSAYVAVVFGGKLTPYVVHQIRICHIPPSTPFDRRSSLPSFGLNTSVNSLGGGSGYMTIGFIFYIPSYVPSSTTPTPLNSFRMKNHPYFSHGPSRRYDTFNYVFPLTYGAIVFGGYLPP